MAAFEGLRAIRLQSALQPEMSIEDVIIILRSTNPDSSSFDLDASQILLEFVDNNVSPNDLCFYQHCIEATILNCRPIWARLMTLGRRKFIKKLDRDEESIFREAGLLIEPPNDRVVTWWDNITGMIRMERDTQILERARKAEKLTIEYEIKQLESHGIYEKPKWIALEDNTAGFDVLSYSKNEFGLVNKLIEVKSTTVYPLRFYLTRNEWEHAEEVGDSYFFYVWNMQEDPPKLFIRTVPDIALHVPQDNKDGKWENALIPVCA